MRRQSGFTLIELVVVIVILGILAAFAVPRFVGMQEEARTSTLKGLKGSLQGAASLGHAKAITNSSVRASNNETITIQGKNVDFDGTWPAATKSGIDDLIQDTSGFNATEDSTLCTNNPCIAYSPNSVADPANCYVSYEFNSTSNNTPTFTNSTADCS